MYVFCRKLRVGLRQLMAGSRAFCLAAVSRHDLMALTDEAARIWGIPHIVDACREKTERVLDE